MSTHHSPASLEMSSISLRLANNTDELHAAQRLRYKTFYEEFHVCPPKEVEKTGRDFDQYDTYADHLIVIDENIADIKNQIIGTYRLFRRENMPDDLPFFSEQEFDISPLKQNGGKLLELGRSCVLPQYRTKHVMQRLWQGIAEYLSEHDIDLMFGCASFHDKKPDNVADALAYLHHFHQPPEHLRPRAITDCTESLTLKEKNELDAKRIFTSLPPLIKGYLRLGAYIGQGAYQDKTLDHIDVCIVLPTENVTEKYKKHYERKIHQG